MGTSESIFLRDILFEIQQINRKLDEMKKPPVIINVTCNDGGLVSKEVIEQLRREMARVKL